MKRPFKIELINHKIDFKKTTYLDDKRSTPVEVEQKSYICPMCHRYKVYLVVAGKIVKGGFTSTGANGCMVSFCGHCNCHRKAQRVAQGWRLWFRELIDEGRWWLAQRTARFTAWLRSEKWYPLDNMAGVPGNRAAELRQQIWERVVSINAAENDIDPIDDKLAELAQLANEAWGHYPSDWAAKEAETKV